MKDTTTKTTTTIDAPMNAPTSVFDDKAFCTEMNKRCTNIKREFSKVESSFMKIAFDLHYIYSKKGYEVLGAKDIYELAKTHFGISRGTSNGFINVVEKFAKRDESGNVLPELQDRFKDFSSSQLLAMLNMTNDALLEISPDMTVREIKKLKKGEDSSVESGEESEIKITEKELPNRQVLISFSTLEEYEKNVDTLDSMILRTLKVKKDEEPKYHVEVVMAW